MPASTAILTILAALLLGAMSPGPSFVIVARNAIGLSRGDGLATALGMGIGGVFFSGIALLGLYTLLATVEWLYVGLKVAGGRLPGLSGVENLARRREAARVQRNANRQRRQSAQVVLDRLEHAAQQSENGCLLRQYLRCAAAAASAGVVLFRAAAGDLRDRGGLVHDRRTVLFEPTAARNLSALEGVDRSHRRERGDRAGPAADF
ncbi:hypothetical protein OKW38_006594 [Paraburkholderia sp. MM5496-R1]